MTRVVECVPNFSEGRDMAKIKQITDVIEAVNGVTLLDVDPGADTNRTVVTFVGSPEAVAEAAFQCIGKAAQVLDMSTHHGSHPRFGATDVCPFIPVEGVTMDDCAQIAREVAERVGAEHGIPVFLYEHAALTPERRNLAVVREGEYEALPERLVSERWKPDFGPAQFNAKAGATAIGAREFLIAYNITLNTRDKDIANDIALELREKGRVARDGEVSARYPKGRFLRYADGAFPCGTCREVSPGFEELAAHTQAEHGYDVAHLLRSNDIDPSDPAALVGEKVYKRGLYDHCKAIGWFVDAYDRAQISVNLTDYHVTAPHTVLEKARELAMERGVIVTGSEVVGVIPFAAMLEAGHYYLAKQGKGTGVPAIDAVKTAVYSMGLADVQPFDIEHKVLGLPQAPEGSLIAMTLSDFTDEVSRDTPAPGGGSIAAVAGSLGAALASMVASLTQGSKYSTPETEPQLVETARAAQEIKDRLVKAVDADTDAFVAYVDALRLPKGTDEEKATRAAAMLAGIKHAIAVPWQTAQDSFEAMKLADTVARIGNPNSITDGAVGVECGFAGVRGGVWNVLVNLKDVKGDPDYIREMQAKCTGLVDEARALLAANAEYVDAKLGEMIDKNLSR